MAQHHYSQAASSKLAGLAQPETPINLAGVLQGATFPASRDDLVRRAEINHADISIVNWLEDLPNASYLSMAAVLQARPGGEEDTYQAIPAETYAEDLTHRPVDLSNHQDRVWSGNKGSSEKLERNHTGNTPETIRSSEPPHRAPAEMQDDPNIGRFEDLSGASSQGQGYELAGGKGANDSSLSDEMTDDRADYLSRRPM